jgi:hypothetical protein
MQVKDFKRTKCYKIQTSQCTVNFSQKWYIKSGHELICCKLTQHRPNITISEKVNGVTSYFFRSKNDSCLTFKKCRNVGATELIKDENKNHFKNGNKGQKF